MVDHPDVDESRVGKQMIPLIDDMIDEDLGARHVKMLREMLLPVFAKLRLKKRC